MRRRSALALLGAIAVLLPAPSSAGAVGAMLTVTGNGASWTTVKLPVAIELALDQMTASPVGNYAGLVIEGTRTIVENGKKITVPERIDSILLPGLDDRPELGASRSYPVRRPPWGFGCGEPYCTLQPGTYRIALVTDRPTTVRVPITQGGQPDVQGNGLTVRTTKASRQQYIQ